MEVDIVIIGGGAAGFFTAINAAEQDPNLRIVILERGSELLTKVKISGGGRCNVTHAEFSPKELSQNYPRGEKELLGPFHSFMTGDTIDWFQQRGIELKIEEDGRMFPVTDSSQTIVDCFLSEAERLNVSILKNHPVKGLKKLEERWSVRTTKGDFIAKNIVIAAGSSAKIWALLENLGHTIIEPVPSLFTFNIEDDRIKELPGVAAPVTVTVLDHDGNAILESEGPLLITHWGMSGPAILKLSAWGARILNPLKYQFQIKVNWLVHDTPDDAIGLLKSVKTELNKKTVVGYAQFGLPKRLWRSLVSAAGISDACTWAELTNEQLQKLANQLTASYFDVIGKSTFKEEFVTSGGVDLKEVNFKTFESKLNKNMYFAGEVLNIDAITGGFNFQNAWTGGYMVAKALTTR